MKMTSFFCVGVESRHREAYWGRNRGPLCALPAASDLASMFIHTGFFTFFATGMDRRAISVIKYIP